MATAYANQFEVEEAMESVENGDIDDVDNVLGEESGDNDFTKARKTLKAKKLIRRSPSKEGVAPNGPSFLTVKGILGQQKNSRRSRTGRRGLPKKGGAGGKGTWGKPGSEIVEEGKTSDSHDPNYDSDNQGGFVVETVEPELTEEEFQKTVEPILAEYLEHGDTNEVAESLGELNIGHHIHHIPVVAINLALDRKNTHREMISVLLSDLYNRILEQEDMARAFDELITNLPELTIDCPEAPTIVGQFIARAVADDCLPPKYVKAYKGKIDCPVASAALEKADILLSMKHGIVRLDNVWGVGGGIRPVKNLIKKMVLLLKEYLSSEDIAEATRCLKELEVPHFNHELIFEGIQVVLEDSSDRTARLITKFFKSLYDTTVVTSDQICKGFKRIFDNMPDICLDVPNAYYYLERFANYCDEAKCIPDRVMRELPNRGRKRFVSEGDGGRVKDTTFSLGIVKENPV